jgi:hypothetical protein
MTISETTSAIRRRPAALAIAASRRARWPRAYGLMAAAGASGFLWYGLVRLGMALFGG